MRKRRLGKRHRARVNWRSIPVLAAIFAVGIGAFTLTSIGIGVVSSMSQVASLEVGHHKECTNVKKECKCGEVKDKKTGKCIKGENKYLCTCTEPKTKEKGKCFATGCCARNPTGCGDGKDGKTEEPKKDDKKKEEGKGEMPKMPEIPKDKDDKKDDKNAQKPPCEQDTPENRAARSECRTGADQGLISKALEGAQQLATNVADSGKQAIENLWANLTGADDSDLQAFDDGSIKAADDIQPSSEAQMQELSNEMKTLDPESKNTSQAKTNADTGNAKRIDPESNSNITGFGAPSSVLTPIQAQKASTQLRGMEQTLFNIIQYLDRIDSAGWWI